MINTTKIKRTIAVLAALFVGGYTVLDSVGIINDPLNIKDVISNDGSTAKKNNAVNVTDYSNTAITYNGENIPQFDGSTDAYILNDNTPFFVTDDFTMPLDTVEFSQLDEYGRAGVANGMLSEKTMQTHERGSISDIHPSGWWEAKNSDVNVNRSHLIGNNLAGDQTDCEENMITGSRQLNAGGTYDGSMLVYENQIADYMETSVNHVRYRVTPVFEGNDAACHGVVMEAESVEDNGAGIKFCVYIYNIQEGYVCDYQTGTWGKITVPELTEDAK